MADMTAVCLRLSFRTRGIMRKSSSSRWLPDGFVRRRSSIRAMLNRLTHVVAAEVWVTGRQQRRPDALYAETVAHCDA
jgi:hypothetical protein